MTRPDRTLVEMFERTCAEHATRPALGPKQGGEWRFLSYGELHGLVERLRGGLARLGVEPGDRVAIVADNRVEWVVAAYATYGLEATLVPLYEAQKPAEREFIVRDSGARVAFAATAEIAQALREARPTLPALEHVVELRKGAPEPSYESLLRAGAESPRDPKLPDPEAIATIIYTSGTTGKPKGVRLSHGNILSNVNAVHDMFSFTEEERSLSFIPWAHVFGQTCELHTMLSLGASIAINDELKHLPENLKEVAPTVLVAVPRIFNRIFAAVHAQVAERPLLVRKLFDAGIRAGRNRAEGRASSVVEELAVHIADPLIFAKVRERFGGRLKYAVSGGAALAPEVAELIQGLGITVYEGYGLTETSPMVSANRPGNVRLGSVGRVVPGVTVRIDRDASRDGRDGEIVVFGPNVMKGYHNRPEEQQKAFTPDGGFRTGDLGYLDEDGFLHVTGRIKEQYKLENGKYVAPVPLEEELKLSPYVANAMIYGANRPYNVALVVLAMDAVRKWAEAEGIRSEDLAAEPRVASLIQREIEARSAVFKDYERPRHFILTVDDFTVENELLTPSLKLKRPRVVERYGAALDSLYS
ncbi:MAG TPA: long-chain fatty acid--CoA ligase [Polyangiaceae bacterium]|nr:long-chain fatty acid--CoA ligase [Polyangiaceae bacterium]